MLSILTAILASIILFTLWSAYCLFQNRRLAIATGLPYVCIPVYEFNLLYFMVSTSRFYTGFVNSLPFGLGDFHKYVQYDWRWKAKHSLHQKHGDVFLTVSPRNLVCNLADPATIEEVVNSRARFLKPTWQYDMLNLYGSNVLTSEDAEWIRLRRYTSRPFNEKNNHIVWREALSQSQGLIKQWTTNSSSTIHDPKGYTVTEVTKDTMKLALHVISYAGFGVSLAFQRQTKPSSATKEYLNDTVPLPPFRVTFREAIQHVAGSIMGVLVTLRCVPRFLTPVLPPFFRKTFNSYDDLETYINRLISDARETCKTSSGGHESDNLLYSLVRNVEPAEDDDKSENVAKTGGLSDADIKGNLFIFTLAGHETTAATIQYAMVLIALYREKQRWLQAMVDEALKGEPEDPMEWDYKRVFPKLNAPLAIMHEALRMFSPVPVIPKWTADNPQTLTYNGKTCHLPPRTVVNIGCPGLHYNPKYWPDPYTFKPERWIPDPSDTSDNSETPGIAYPKMKTPVKCSFLSFSDGVRACLGQKFAQVEFAALFATLAKSYTVELVPREGESIEECDKRIKDILENSSTRVSLMLRTKVELRLVKRK